MGQRPRQRLGTLGRVCAALGAVIASFLASVLPAQFAHKKIQSLALRRIIGGQLPGSGATFFTLRLFLPAWKF
jgi:hypothetical protein